MLSQSAAGKASLRTLKKKMSNKATIADLFEPEPKQWDPYLWREMAQHFCDAPSPSSPIQLTAALEEAFHLLTNKSISFSGYIHIPRHCNDGMSSGGISTEFWRNKAIPLLLSRFMGQSDNPDMARKSLLTAVTHSMSQWCALKPKKVIMEK